MRWLRAAASEVETLVQQAHAIGEHWGRVGFLLLLADTRAVLRVVDIERVRGWVRRERADVARAQEEIDALLQRSTEAFPAVTLGL